MTCRVLVAKTLVFWSFYAHSYGVTVHIGPYPTEAICKEVRKMVIVHNWDTLRCTEKIREAPRGH